MNENSKIEHPEEAPRDDSVREKAFVALVAKLIVKKVWRKYHLKMEEESKKDEESIAKSSISRHLENDEIL